MRGWLTWLKGVSDCCAPLMCLWTFEAARSADLGSFTPGARPGLGRRSDGHAPVHGPRFDPGNHLDGIYRRNLADVQVLIEHLYIWDTDVAISTLRAELSTWIERARSGQEVVVTDRGTPVARLRAVDTALLLDQLIASGVLSEQAAP